METRRNIHRQKTALVIMGAVYLVFFIVALVSLNVEETQPTQLPPVFTFPTTTGKLISKHFKNRTIIATAIPRISDDLKALEDIGWYGSVYFINNCSTQLIFGKIYTLYSPKWVFIFAIVLFEIGSAVCDAAPNSIAFIFGRAIAGMGSSAIFAGAVVIILHTIPLPKRPMYLGFLGSTFGLASVVAPLLGGVFTDKVSWRWCFYINLPIGAVTLAIVIFVLKMPKTKSGTDLASAFFKKKMLHLDPFGMLCFFPGMLCLLLALQWDGRTYGWNSARIIVLLAVFVLLLLGFVGLQVWNKEYANVPGRIAAQRSMVAGVYYTICTGGHMLVVLYYLPIWFQAIKGVSAVNSGINILPTMLSVVVGGIAAGTLVSKIGYYTPFMILSTVFSSVGTGLMITFTKETGHAKWIGYQVLYGFGLGTGMQHGHMAAQTVLPKKDVPIGAALMLFAQSLGGAIFIAVGQNVFTNGLASRLATIPGIDVSTLVDGGATTLRDHIKSPKILDRVLSEYNDALLEAFHVAFALACLSLLGGLAMEWRNVKRQKKD
ncbi:hypothetical protein I7I51_03746 [Histoplasma capsulatum]|uniref:Major facilitator superfamily (MFS) profile domain-containing protein n=1 Tax=Ajellomyces capsulatus TaxID=5037 RepID=A0A8A1M6C4_AJECA|nr:hypothetical protein I7I51_03746 [Histoplasma capsulatum]